MPFKHKINRNFRENASTSVLQTRYAKWMRTSSGEMHYGPSAQISELICFLPSYSTPVTPIYITLCPSYLPFERLCSEDPFSGTVRAMVSQTHLLGCRNYRIPRSMVQPRQLQWSTCGSTCGRHLHARSWSSVPGWWPQDRSFQLSYQVANLLQNML